MISTKNIKTKIEEAKKNHRCSKTSVYKLHDKGVVNFASDLFNQESVKDVIRYFSGESSCMIRVWEVVT